MTGSSGTKASLRRLGKALLLCLALHAGALQADEDTARRVVTGAKFFPAVVAADEALSAKRSSDGRIHLAVLYRDLTKPVKKAAGRIREAGKIQTFPVSVDLVSFSDLAALKGHPPAALFVADATAPDVAAVMAFGQATRRLVFSPLEGDVRRGIPAGIAFTDHIQPLLNVQALKASDLHLQPFIFRIAITYE